MQRGGIEIRRNEQDARPFYYSQVRVDPALPDRVYWSSTPVQFSDDGVVREVLDMRDWAFELPGMVGAFRGRDAGLLRVGSTCRRGGFP